MAVQYHFMNLWLKKDVLQTHTFMQFIIIYDEDYWSLAALVVRWGITSTSYE